MPSEFAPSSPARPTLRPENPALWKRACDLLFTVVSDYVTLIDEHGVFVDANEAALEWLGTTREDAMGKPIATFLPPSIVQERTGLYTRCAREREPVCLEGYIGGVLIQCNLRPFSLEGDGGTYILCVSRPVRPGLSDGGVPTSRAQTHDMGPLAKLTDREIEVLGHIGRGLTTAQIAKAMHRSVKTIEWHRVSLGNKLEASNRVELARFAIRYGLTSVHADEPELEVAGPRTLDGAK
ncbi:MAG: PAS domain-containing protein [Phycisphaeraceae bacterium]|nr:PAS domain-containing protein [Phycisphaeraceae bacterium]